MEEEINITFSQKKKRNEEWNDISQFENNRNNEKISEDTEDNNIIEEIVEDNKNKNTNEDDD